MLGRLCAYLTETLPLRPLARTAVYSTHFAVRTRLRFQKFLPRFLRNGETSQCHAEVFGIHPSWPYRDPRVSRLPRSFGLKDLAAWRLWLEVKLESKLDRNKMLRSRLRYFLKTHVLFGLSNISLVPFGLN